MSPTDRTVKAKVRGRKQVPLTNSSNTGFYWGWNSVGQLGLGYSDGAEPLPQQVDALIGLNVCAVATGSFASCAVTAAGQLYTWGSGDQGRLGHGDATAQFEPERVEALQDEWVVAASAGIKHTIAVTRDCRVFSWGATDGLGLPETAAAEHEEEDEAGALFIMLPRRYPQLSCAPYS